MERTFHLFDHFGDVVQRQAWPEVAEITGFNLEVLSR